MKRARLYVRVSSDEQAKKGLSIPVQLENLKKYCKENEYEIADIYIDNGISAGTIKKRHEFVRMLNELETNDTILITRLDRMSRNVYDANFLLQKFEPLNVHFKAILEDDIDTTSADGKFIFDLKVSLAERERKKTSERMKDIFDSKRAKGEWCGGMIPLGYKLDETKHLAPHEQLADAVRYLFNAYSNNHRLREIQRNLKEKYGVDYSFRGLYDVLGNKRYYGYFGDTPLISESLFHQAQSVRDKATSYAKVKEGRTYLFQTLVKCRCGRTMLSTYNKFKANDRIYIRYTCPVPLTKPDGQKHSNINEMKLENLFVNELEPYRYQHFEIWSKPKDEPTINDIDNAIEKKSRIKEMYIEGFIDRERFDKEMSEIESVLSKDFSKADTAELLSTISDIKDFYLSLSREEKQIFIASLVDEIVIESPKNIKFKFK